MVPTQVVSPESAAGSAIPYTPGNAGKVTKTVDRDRNCLLERRYEKARGKMSKMVLDIMHAPRKRIARELMGQDFLYGSSSAGAPDPVQN